MFPLTIKDFPASVQDGLQDFISALDLVPFRLTHRDDPNVFWTIYADSEAILLAGELIPQEPSVTPDVLPSYKCSVLPRQVFNPFVYIEPYQFEIEWPTV